MPAYNNTFNTNFAGTSAFGNGATFPMQQPQPFYNFGNPMPAYNSAFNTNFAGISPFANNTNSYGNVMPNISNGFNAFGYGNINAYPSPNTNPGQPNYSFGQPTVSYGNPYAVMNPNENYLVKEKTQITQPVPVPVEVPVYIDRPVEVPVEKIVEKPVYIEVPVEVPGPTRVITKTKTKKAKKKKKKKKSPLAFDLNRNGIQTKTQKVNFDMDGSGKLSRVNDINDGILSIDLNRNGNSGDNGKELLGDYTDLSALGITQKFTDGFEALKALADHAKAKDLINQDNTLDSSELATMEQAYGLKMKLDGLNIKAVSLSQAGVTSINLSDGAKQHITNFDGRDNDTRKQEGATFTTRDGATSVYEDVFLKV